MLRPARVQCVCVSSPPGLSAAQGRITKPFFTAWRGCGHAVKKGGSTEREGEGGGGAHTGAALTFPGLDVEEHSSVCPACSAGG